MLKSVKTTNCYSFIRKMSIMNKLIVFFGVLFAFPCLAQNNNDIRKVRNLKQEAKFQKMSTEEVKRYETKLMRQVADLALIPPQINTSPLPEYDYDTQHYVMALTMERTVDGRIWFAWIGECDCPSSYLLAATSDDDGETWSKPRLVIDGRSSSIPIQRDRKSTRLNSSH